MLRDLNHRKNSPLEQHKLTVDFSPVVERREVGYPGATNSHNLDLHAGLSKSDSLTDLFRKVLDGGDTVKHLLEHVEAVALNY